MLGRVEGAENLHLRDLPRYDLSGAAAVLSEIPSCKNPF